MSASIRIEMASGVTQGLALSAVLWTVALSPPSVDASLVLLSAAAAGAGATIWAARRWVGVSATYAVVLAALQVQGPSAALIVGLLACAAGQPFWSKGRGGLRRLLPRWTEVALATSAASLAYAIVPERWFAPDALPLLPVLAHATTYAIARAGSRRFLALATNPRPRVRSFLIDTCRLALLHAPAIPVAAAVGWGISSSRGSIGLPVTCVLVVFGVLVRDHRHRERMARDQRSELRARFRCGAEALAEMIRIRDDRAEAHLRRVQGLCLEAGSRLGMSAGSLEVLGLAALLHDIGKVGVSDRILSKPGRLTGEERTAVERHTVFGAEILETMECPSELSRIVRHHHERWDGSGYPAGLRGPEIPLGARVLSAVDTYDALTSDRPYRGAVSREEASAFLERESGSWFDPQVVTVLLDCLDERGEMPVVEPQALEPHEAVVLETAQRPRPIPQAQVELQALYDISRTVAEGLEVERCLTLVACKLTTLVPYRSLVVYLEEPEGHLLRACYAIGVGANRLRSMTVPLGERLSGWAALQRRACIGRSHVTPLERDGFRSDLEEWSEDAEIGSLQSTLAAPITSRGQGLGVVTLYDAAREYTAEDRRILTRVAGLLAPLLERARSAGPPAAPSLTDPLTGVPNARFLRLEAAHRLAADPPGFGLLAFRVQGLDPIGEKLGNGAVDRILSQIARRLATNCGEREALVRFGQDLFLVLSDAHRSDDLVQRARVLSQAVDDRPLDIEDGLSRGIQLSAALACAPADGDDLDSLLGTLDGRLNLAAHRSPRTVVPFRRRQALLGESARSG